MNNFEENIDRALEEEMSGLDREYAIVLTKIAGSVLRSLILNSEDLLSTGAFARDLAVDIHFDIR